MRFFNFLKKPTEASPADNDFQKARELFNEGKYADSLKSLTSGFRADSANKELYKLAAQNLKKLNGADEEKLFMAAYHNFNDASAFNELGRFYLTCEYYDLAKPFFERTLQLSPMNYDAAHDLAICYARRFDIKNAVELLSNLPSGHFWNEYFLCKCKILNNDTEGVVETIDNLSAFLNAQPDQDELVIGQLKLLELREMLERYHSVNPVEKHIRPWHYIQYGAAVLDYFESDEYVAGGRYVASWGSMESIKAAACDLKKFIDALQLKFDAVAALPGRDSEIVGRVIAHELGIDFSLYEKGKPLPNQLVVSADSADFNNYHELSHISTGQVLYSLNHCWFSGSAICPDVAGFMTQMYYMPWSGGQLKFVDGKTEKSAEDTRPAHEIALEIYNLPAAQDDISASHDFYVQHKAWLKSIGDKGGTHRYAFMVESPVPGAYFT